MVGKATALVGTAICLATVACILGVAACVTPLWSKLNSNNTNLALSSVEAQLKIGLWALCLEINGETDCSGNNWPDILVDDCKVYVVVAQAFSIIAIVLALAAAITGCLLIGPLSSKGKVGYMYLAYSCFMAGICALITWAVWMGFGGDSNCGKVENYDASWALQITMFVLLIVAGCVAIAALVMAGKEEAPKEKVIENYDEMKAADHDPYNEVPQNSTNHDPYSAEDELPPTAPMTSNTPAEPQINVAYPTY